MADDEPGRLDTVKLQTIALHEPVRESLSIDLEGHYEASEV